MHKVYLLYNRGGQNLLQFYFAQSLQIIEYPSYADLLVSLLNNIFFSTPLYGCDIRLSLDIPLKADTLQTYISDIFIDSLDICPDASPSERLVALASFDKVLRNIEYHFDKYLPFYAYDERTDDIDTKLHALQKNIEDKYGPMQLQRSLAFALLKLSNLIRIQAENQYSFPSLSNLILWLIDSVATANTTLGVCPVCGHYFSNKYSQIYCSPSCRRTNTNLNAFHGEKELLRIYKCINTLLASKEKCSKKNGLPYIVPENGNEVVYDITAIKKTYENDNRARLDAFNKAYAKMQWNSCLETEEAYMREKEAYLDWLKEQHRRIQSLRLDGDASPAETIRSKKTRGKEV